MRQAFEGEVSASAQFLGLTTYQKIPIAHKLGRRGNLPVLIPLDEAPYDSFFVYRGRHVALEMKSSKCFESFPLGRLDDHQRDGLRAITAQGGHAFLLLNFRNRKEAGKLKRENRAYAFDMGYWDALIAALEASKSIPSRFYQERPTWFLPVPRRRVTRAEQTQLVWDLHVITDYLTDRGASCE